MSKIGLLVAMRAEIPGILQKRSGLCQVGRHTMQVLVSGIGPRRARRATEKLCTGYHHFHPDYVMAVGFCGSTRDELDVGHAVIARQVAYRGQQIALDETLTDQAIDAARGMAHRVGQFEMFDWPVFSRKRVSIGTLAVDMESFAIANAAQDHDLPALIVKVVSDVVPERASVGSVLSLSRLSIKEAKRSLDAFAECYFLSDCVV